ncbi:MAG: GNAT family N-acetyltransferase [candidate division Zixibacteria bacterium]|nr:GNAT family N-acetyltransferase [candidate division Zixibacteria bacterium]MBU1469954.1 GNAT family N-acetyltransferase [candidate division Zixibacteria bacterium]MBU2626067.1 GNAT family N-acetyltransferase [candidate division Zixibacteria bacterium]
MPNVPLIVRAKLPTDSNWIVDLLTNRWGSTKIVTRSVLHDADRLPAFVAVSDDERIGLATYRIEGDQCEMISLDSMQESIGVGSALIEAVKDVAHNAGCSKLWLITTNDNAHAIRFYQRRGFALVAVHANAIEESRKLKPSIPLFGVGGAPICDEIEFEIKF